MKFSIVVALAALALLACAETNRVSGLQIHIFDVGQAMSQLWIYPSGYTVFVDGPEVNWKSAEKSKAVAKKLNTLLNGTKVIDVGVISHLHLDHLGYAGIGGLWSLIENYGFSFKKLIERDSGRWVDLNNDGECTEDEIQFNNVGTLSSTVTRWIFYATNSSSHLQGP